MDHELQMPLWMNSDKLSFAYPSARDRWPIILTQGIDDVHKAVAAASDPDVIAEGKEIISKIAGLKYELQHDRELTPLPDDGASDVKLYNDEIAATAPLKWFAAPWLFSECYMYRRVNAYFAMSNHWKTYDLFERQKMATFKDSRTAVVELAAQYKEIVSELEKDHTLKQARTQEELEKAEELLFIEMCEICLWGNATDLSLLTNISIDDIKKLQGSAARKKAENNILANDLSKAFAILNKAKNEGKQERRVDFVLDNAGFELYVDLILAGYLLATGLATTIVLRPKSLPWFVSDVVPKDFIQLIQVLADPQPFYSAQTDGKDEAPKPLSDKEVEELKFLFQQWSGAHAEGQLIIRPDRFWTEGGSFWRLGAPQNKDLLDDLKEAELCIFKGDLNYRKLTGDGMWDPTTPFAEAVGPLGPKSGVRTLALRTCKGDVVVGLPQGKDEELRAAEGGGGDSGARQWAWKGKWAVVQLCDGKA